MISIRHAFLCTIVSVLMITAGCIQNTPTPAAPVTTGETTAVPTVSSTMTVPPGTPSSGTCTADISDDAANCGECGYACPANAICQQAQCFCKEGYTAADNQCVSATTVTGAGNGCPAGMSPCPDGYCYELASSDTNCGICGNICPAGMICSASTCITVPSEITTTPVTLVTAETTLSRVHTLGTLSAVTKNCMIFGQTSCDGICVNLTTSNGNCGSCGQTCSGLSPTCCGGTCTNLNTDESNCGTCGHTCNTLSTCVSGSCKSAVVVTRVTLAKAVPSLKIVNPDILAPVGPQI